MENIFGSQLHLSVLLQFFFVFAFRTLPLLFCNVTLPSGRGRNGWGLIVVVTRAEP